jgi:hypothetical protein
MKHADLIRGAVDGKTVQWKYTDYRSINAGLDRGWHKFDMQLLLLHFGNYPNGQEGVDYRIEPKPIPDKVWYDVLGLHRFSDLHAAQQHFGKERLYLKLTIKTDEDGVETKTVEIV